MTDRDLQNTDGSLVPVFVLLPQPPAPPTREELEDLVLALAGYMGCLSSQPPVTYTGALASLYVVAQRVRASRDALAPGSGE